MPTERVTLNVQDILTPTKAAKYLGISRMTLWRWVRDGKIIPVMLDHAYFHITEVNRVKELVAKGLLGKG
jgi:predicted site-specific integrase-resolvase